jgi:hypothetical protein
MGCAGQVMELTIQTKILVGKRNSKRDLGVAWEILLRWI